MSSFKRVMTYSSMPHVTDLRVCKKCFNVYSAKVEGITHYINKCPQCGDVNGEPVFTN